MSNDSLSFVTNPTSSGAARSLGRFIEKTHRSRIKRRTPKTKAIVKQRTLRTLGHLPRLADAEIVLRTEEAARTGWHKQHPLAYEDVEAMLRDALKETHAHSVISDITYLAGKVMPFMKEHDLSPAGLIGPSGNVAAKARAVVPRLRVHERSAGSEVEKTDLWLKEIAVLDDPKITEDEIRARNQGSAYIPHIHIYEKQVNSQTVELKMTVSVQQARYIQKRLDGKCKWHRKG